MYSPVARYIDEFTYDLDSFDAAWLTYEIDLMHPDPGTLGPKYDQFSGSPSNSLKQLRRDWDFLKFFEESIFRCVVGEEIQSRVRKLNAVVVEIRKNIFGCGTPSTRAKYYGERPDELLCLLNEFQRKTDELCNSEIRNALEELKIFTFCVRVTDNEFWNHFVRCVAHKLRFIADYGVINKKVGFLPDELERIRSYLNNVRGSLKGSHKEIDDFLTHVGSVVLRIAIQSCNFWFNRTEPKIAEVTAGVLLDLHREIDPTHPEFLQLNLRFQKFLHEIISKTTTPDEYAFVDYFCSYLLIGDDEDDLRKELKSLVALYLNTTLKDGEDVQSFFAEIKVVLGEAAFFRRTGQQEATFSLPLPCSELVTKLCLLKGEFFLKELLNTSTSLTLFNENQFFKVDMFLANVRAFTKYLCQKQNTEYLRQSSALAEELNNKKSGSKWLGNFEELKMHSHVARHIDAFIDTLEIFVKPTWLIDDHKKQSAGLMERTRRLFEPKYDYDQLSRSLFNSLKQLVCDWDFSKIFVESIFRSAITFNWVVAMQKLDPVVVEIHKDIFGCDTPSTRENYYRNRPHELLSLLNECQRKTDELCNSEIRNALDELKNFTFCVRDTDNEFWNHFVRCVAHKLRFIADYGVINKQVGFLPDELERIGSYLNNVRGSLGGSHKEIDDFLTQVGSVVLRIAIQSCNFWFNRTEPEIAEVTATALLDLHQEIDATHPKFLQLNLKFLKVLHKIKFTYEYIFVDYFCSYLLISDYQDDLRKELKSLVALYLNTTLKDGEDVHSFFAEIKAVLGEAAFFRRTVQPEATFSVPPPCPELATKVCLLKAEFFLKEQLNISTSCMLFSENQFFKVDMFLANLRAFTKYLCQEQNMEYLRRSLALAEELYNEVESLHISLQSERITNSLIKHSLLQLLFKIVFFKAESFLTKLLKSSDTLISDIGALVEELKYFKRIITSKLASESSKEKIVISQVEVVVREMIFFSYPIPTENDKFNKMIRLLPPLLDKLKIVRAKLIQQFPKSIFPKTYELGFIDFLGRNIRELLIYDPEWIAPVKHHVKEAQLHLEYLKSFLMKVKDSDFEQGESKDLVDHIIHVSYKLEYVVELIEVDLHPSLQQSVWLYDLIEDIRLVHEQVSKTHEMPCAGEVQNLPLISCEMISRDTKPTVDEMVVDLGDEEEAIIDRLTRGSLQRNVVPIVGMPGIGKTTLAKKVYDNQIVIFHFRHRAWCTVSRIYSKRGLLLEILSDIHGLTEEIHRMTDEDLLLKLRRCLLKNKYLIVMDDVWGIEAWKDLEQSFPDDHNGSRILMTSRLQDVSLKIKPDSVPHSVRLLSADECWRLLERKIFKGKTCPEKLLEVGMEIARNCQGLPLAVVAIAGLLQKTEKRRDWWKKISKSLSSEIINDPENWCMEILELSYKHLPECLKACFLYLGIFLEDKDIPVNKLIRFWMAEGFIQESESKSLEDVAEEYLMELINRSLVIISKTRSNGKVKACRLHDLLRDLCLLKAKEENFFHPVTRNDEPYSSFPESDYEMELGFDELAPITFESYRLGFYLKINHFVDSRPSGPGTRSLLFFASTDSDQRCPYDILFISQNFKLLRVLDLECINLGVSFPVEIGLMAQLRYLAVSGYINSIPPSIAKLRKLETLVVKGLRGKVMLPETIWSMARLRHLHVNNHVVFSLQGLDDQVGSSFHLDNLVSFSTPSLSSGEDTMNILRRLPNLRKMRCLWYSSKNCGGFPILKLLTHLESLKMIYYGRSLNSGEFVLPLNLKKLTLSRFQLPWDHISGVGRLPNLRVLKLHAGAFEGHRWDMREEEFGELKFLELDTLNIVEWNASCDHLPKLEKLVLRNCKDLEVIPYDFAGINTLQMIEVQWCGKSVEESAKEIGDVTGEIKVLVSHS